MAEPAGLLIRGSITEAALSEFFRRTIHQVDREISIGRMLSEHLNHCDEDADILIVHHDAKKGDLFVAWVLNHYTTDAIAPVWSILQILADHLSPSLTAAGVVASTLSIPLEAVRIEGGHLIREPGEAVDQAHLAELLRRFWAFAPDGQFPDAARSMRRPHYQCKAFRNAWKDYVSWRDEQQRPARIALATEAEPYRLRGNVYCWGGHVFERDTYTHRDIPFPGADALTFRYDGGYYADKSQVWRKALADGSPPASIRSGQRIINNPAAVWEYVPVPGADGASFTWLYDRFDTMFWRDARRIYSLDDGVLVSLPDVQADQFREYGQCFGTDGRSVFWFARQLPLNPERLGTDGYFIWDDKRAFFCAHALPLGGEGFRVEVYENVDPNGQRQYRLSSVHGTVIWQPDFATG